MNKHARILAVLVFAIAIGVQTGCDQTEVTTDPEPSEIVSKGADIATLGKRLAKDSDFQALQKLLDKADKKARMKYYAGANLAADLAFAKIVEKKTSLTKSEKSKLTKIRALSEKEFKALYDLRQGILSRFPEIQTLTKEELADALSYAGVGHGPSVGKTFDQCDNCNYAYNSCISGAEFRHAIEVISCSLLIQTVFGGSVCYLASLSKYLWTVSSCRQTKEYCRSNNGCDGAAHDTA